jgi:hypothetical protein
MKKQVYLLAALLSATAEKNPDFAWRLNMEGLFTILDLAKEKYVDKIFTVAAIFIEYFSNEVKTISCKVGIAKIFNLIRFSPVIKIHIARCLGVVVKRIQERLSNSPFASDKIFKNI